MEFVFRENLVEDDIEVAERVDRNPIGKVNVATGMASRVAWLWVPMVALVFGGAYCVFFGRSSGTAVTQKAARAGTMVKETRRQGIQTFVVIGAKK